MDHGTVGNGIIRSFYIAALTDPHTACKNGLVSHVTRLKYL